MSGPHTEGGPLPAPNREALARHEERIAEFFAEARTRAEAYEPDPEAQLERFRQRVADPSVRRQRVLAIVPDERGGWDVEVSPEDPAEQSDPGDPALVRLFVDDGTRWMTLDLPDEVLRRIADRIREL